MRSPDTQNKSWTTTTVTLFAVAGGCFTTLIHLHRAPEISVATCFVVGALWGLFAWLALHLVRILWMCAAELLSDIFHCSKPILYLILFLLTFTSAMVLITTIGRHIE